MPDPALADLQRRAREVDTEERLREIAHEFTGMLASLTPEQLHALLSTPASIAAESEERQPPAPGSTCRGRNETFLATVMAALAELPTRFRTRLTVPEEIQAELIARAAQRLAEIDGRLTEDGLTVPGSHGQLRPHPLLSFELGLRRELTNGLRQFEFIVRSRAQVERLNALTRDSPRAKPSDRAQQPQPSVTATAAAERASGLEAASPP